MSQEKVITNAWHSDERKQVVEIKNQKEIQPSEEVFFVMPVYYDISYSYEKWISHGEIFCCKNSKLYKLRLSENEYKDIVNRNKQIKEEADRVALIEYMTQMCRKKYIEFEKSKLGCDKVEFEEGAENLLPDLFDGIIRSKTKHLIFQTINRSIFDFLVDKIKSNQPLVEIDTDQVLDGNQIQTINAAAETNLSLISFGMANSDKKESEQKYQEILAHQITQRNSAIANSILVLYGTEAEAQFIFDVCKENKIKIKKVYFDKNANVLFAKYVSQIEKFGCNVLQFTLADENDADFICELIEKNYQFSTIIVDKELDEEEIAKLNASAQNNVFLEDIIFSYLDEKQEEKHKSILSLALKNRNTLLTQGKLVLGGSTDEIIAIIDKIIQLKLNDTIKIIDLSNNQLDDTFFDKFSQILETSSFKALENLNLEGNNFTAKIFTNLLNILNKNKSLIIINLQKNRIDFSCDESKDFLEYCVINETSQLFGDQILLRVNKGKISLFFDYSLNVAFNIINTKKIRTLDFKKKTNPDSETSYVYNSVDNNKLIEILDKMVEALSCITALSFVGTKIYSTAVQKLSGLLKNKNCNLAYLDISIPYENSRRLTVDTPLDEADMLLIFDALKVNKKLVSLNLSGQSITGTANLSAGLLENATLSELYLVDTNVSEDNVKTLLATLKPPKKNKKTKRNNALSSFHVSQKKAIRITNKKGDTKDMNAYSKGTINVLKTFNQNNAEHQKNLKNKVEAGELDEVKQLSQETSIYYYDDNKNYLLHLAVLKKQFFIVKYFVCECEYTYNLELTNKQGKTALDLALEEQKKHEDNTDENLENIITLLQNPLAKPSKQNKSSSSQSSVSAKRKLSAVSDQENTDKQAPKKKKAKIQISQNSSSSSSCSATTITTTQKSSTKSQIANDEGMEVGGDESEESDENQRTQPMSSTASFTRHITLFDYVASRNYYEIKKQLASDNAKINSVNNEGDSLLHIAISNIDMKNVEILLDANINVNLTNGEGKTALLSLIEKLPDCQTSDRYLLLRIALLLIKAEASIEEYLLHKVVKTGDLRLVKILLCAKDCDPNQKDEERNTALDYAVLRFDTALIERFLIDRRVTTKTVEQAKEKLEQIISSSNNSSSSSQTGYERILTILNQRLKNTLPAPRAGIQWTKSHTLFYGSSREKSLCIHSEKQHGYLASQNQHTKAHYDEDTNTKEALKKLGNPVSASLVFIVSQGVHQPHQSCIKTKIRVPLDFLPTFHHNASEEEEDIDASELTKDHIKYRVDSAPKEAFEGTFPQRKNYKPLDSAEIQEAFENASENNDRTYRDKFHHGEQSLMEHLEKEETSEKIAKSLISHSKFVKKSKIYAVILELYTPRYPCENCEISVLGLQNPDRSKFIKNLTGTLKSYECVLPTFSPLRMVTQISTNQAHNSNKVEDEEHLDLRVDIRDCQNNLILAKDESSFAPVLTQFHSNKLHHSS